MIEIYKKNLYDLLSAEKTDLKIKFHVATENELLDILMLGEQVRKVASTRVN